VERETGTRTETETETETERVIGVVEGTVSEMPVRCRHSGKKKDGAVANQQNEKRYESVGRVTME
jgi:hypothetical protein